MQLRLPQASPQRLQNRRPLGSRWPSQLVKEWTVLERVAHCLLNLTIPAVGGGGVGAIFSFRFMCCFSLHCRVLSLNPQLVKEQHRRVGGHRSVVREPEFRSEDPGFSPMVGQGQGPTKCVSARVNSCANMFVPDSLRVYGTHKYVCAC